MALLDRVRDAARPTNRIEAAQPRALDPQRADAASRAGGPAAAQAPRKAEGSAVAAAEPEAITQTYYVEQRGNSRRFYHDYQRESFAMRADATSISSRREDLTTIRAMLTLAEARGWSDIKVAGSATFRREAWIEAQARGLSARGHAASDLDRQEADRRRAERGPGQSRSAATAGSNTLEPTAPSAPAKQAAAAEAAQAPRATAAPAASVVVQPAGPVPVAANRSQADRGRADRTQRAAFVPGSVPGSERAGGGKPRLASSGNRRVRSPAGAVAGPTPEPAKMSAPEHRRAIQDAVGKLSPDGQLILAALAEKIDRQMSKLSADAKLETKAYAAAELLKKERRDGPVVLSPELRIVSSSPAPAPLPQAGPTLQSEARPRHAEPEPARRSRGR